MKTKLLTPIGDLMRRIAALHCDLLITPDPVKRAVLKEQIDQLTQKMLGIAP